MFSLIEFNKEILALYVEIDEYYNLPAGWDNETDEATNPKCLDFAKQFISLLNSNCIVPEFSAGSGEEVALYWDNGKFYLIIHFFESGKMRYYYENPDTKDKVSGLLNGLNSSLPPQIAVFISR